MTERYGIAEWFGLPFTRLSADHRQMLAATALGQTRPPPCPFQRGRPQCSKRGGVCSIRAGEDQPVITCPNRFDDGGLIPRWLAQSAKWLMPQLQVKGPTLRRWGTKLAVTVDLPFFDAIGGPSTKPSRDLNDGDIIWLIPRVTDDYRLVAHHWEVLSLEASSDKLLSAETVKRQEFEAALRTKLQRIGGAS